MKPRTLSHQEPTLYLNLIWHQHQPLYLDPERDQLVAPWVRTHGTKDYYTMPALLAEYPDIHCTINLTPVLLLQLEEYYVARLKPFINGKTGSLRKDAIQKIFGGKTDPWIDLALKDTRQFDTDDLSILLEGSWNAFGVSESMLDRFPQYRRLKDKWHANPHSLTTDDLRSIKFFFFLAHFDPMFLEKKVQLPNRIAVDVRNLVKRRPDGTYELKKEISEADCKRIVVEAFKVLANIVRVHKLLMYKSASRKGQVELTTTPFFHPILPLVFDSDVSRFGQPKSPLPARFHFPNDVETQLKLAITCFQKLFGVRPRGVWPAEGGVSHDIAVLFGKHGIHWIATDEKILAKSKPAGLSKHSPHPIKLANGADDSVAVFFRDTELSDKVGFVYKDYDPKVAAEDFVRILLKHSPKPTEGDRIVTVILDGENAWEWYRHDPEGRGFLRILYQKLTQLYRDRKVVTVTPTEYIHGNLRRGVPPHPLRNVPAIDWLWPGSWINANFDTWIGDRQKNLAWDFLKEAREGLEKSGFHPPKSLGRPSARRTKKWYAHRAWEELLAAEGSDWFWWMGSEQSHSGKPGPMADLFIKHVNSIYEFANRAGAHLRRPDLTALRNSLKEVGSSIGTMEKGKTELVKVKFQCDARHVKVPAAIYIVGDHPLLGSWVPNKVLMYDDETHGDLQAGDGIWTFELAFPLGTEIHYKFTNSGTPGHWNPGEEFPALNRRLRIRSDGGYAIELLDVFGKL